MSGLKKIMITPYFGKLPPWMDKFEPPKGYTWIVDNNIVNFYDRVKAKLGIAYPGIPGSGKVWDYRCALGLLYEEEIKGFDFWGHMDFDMVFGDVDEFLPDATLTELDVYSGHDEYVCGCFSLYRNNPVVNKLFQDFYEWKEKMWGSEPNGWVEKEFSQILEWSGLRYAYTFNQGNPWDKNPILKKQAGKLFQVLDDKWIEIMFFHFRHSKRWPL